MTTMLAPDRTAQPEEDWFGEGSSFDTGEELAAALFALAGTVDPASGGPLPVHEPLLAEAPAAQEVGDHLFEFVAPVGGGVAFQETRTLEPAPASSPAPDKWGVRSSSTSLLPLPRAGQTGWSIRTSVQVLHRTDDVLRQLREAAVAAAFSSAAEAFRLAKPASERLRPPRAAA